MAFLPSIQIIDSHTGGEPTRIVYGGGPDLGTGPLQHRLELFKTKFDVIRRQVINEPRGNDVLVGGLICPPSDPDSAAAVIFFNNLGYLGMCGHGLIGLTVTLKYLQRIGIGSHKIETPVGTVIANLISDHEVTFQNVPAFCLDRDVSVNVPGYGTVVGDVAWGGNWFFLVKNSEEELELENVSHLTEVCLKIRNQLNAQKICGLNGAWIDHVELFASAKSPDNDSRNFVLCPGGAYDRSPCGTGTSAKLACLAAEGRLEPGQVWRQESIVGSLFTGTYQFVDQSSQRTHDSGSIPYPVIVPAITGSAYICGQGELLFDSSDPFQNGII